MISEENQNVNALSRLIFACAGEAHNLIENGLEFHQSLIEESARELVGVARKIRDAVARETLNIRIEKQEVLLRRREFRHRHSRETARPKRRR